VTSWRAASGCARTAARQHPQQDAGVRALASHPVRHDGRVLLQNPFAQREITGQLQKRERATGPRADLWVKDGCTSRGVVRELVRGAEELDRTRAPAASGRATGSPATSAPCTTGSRYRSCGSGPAGAEGSTASQPTAAALPEGGRNNERTENVGVGDALWDNAPRRGARIVRGPRSNQTGGRFWAH